MSRSNIMMMYSLLNNVIATSITLNPEKCISDVDTNTVGVEWTPEGYINRMKIMLPVMPIVSETRMLERINFWINQQYRYHHSGDIKFKAHISPHKPRSGETINYCYVIEESIASGIDLSKALFLLNGDKTASLLRTSGAFYSSISAMNGKRRNYLS